MIKCEFFIDGGQRDLEVVFGGWIALGQCRAQTLDRAGGLVELNRQLSRANDITQRGEEEYRDLHDCLYSSATKSPREPPRFSKSLISPMRMPRSTAFAMS